MLFSSLKSLVLLLARYWRGSQINKIVRNACRPRVSACCKTPAICPSVVSMRKTANGGPDFERLCPCVSFILTGV